MSRMVGGLWSSCIFCGDLIDISADELPCFGIVGVLAGWSGSPTPPFGGFRQNHLLRGFARGVSTCSAAQGLESRHAFFHSQWITVLMTKHRALGSLKCLRSRRKWPPATPNQRNYRPFEPAYPRIGRFRAVSVH